MKKIFCILFSILFSCTFLNAQGLIFDKEAFKNRKAIEKTRAEKIPSSASMKKYAPITFLQQNSSCVAYSMASARTMLIAKNNNLTGDDITVNAISPHWIYYRNKDRTDADCEEGLNIEKCMVDLLNFGAPRMAFVEYPSFYPFSENILCNYYPPNLKEDSTEALKWTPDNIYSLTDLESIKIALSKEMAVVVGMLVPESFQNSDSLKKWSPASTDNYDNSYGHAMVVVGFDDNKYGGAVELLNSWGANWGENGFIWINYDDFLKYTLGAYAIEKKRKFGAKPNNLKTKEDLALEKDIKLSLKKGILETDISKFKALSEKFKLLNSKE